MAQFYPLTVAEVRRETRDSVVVTLAAPAAHAARFRFIQGQYLTVRTQLDGEEVRRSYSICSAPHENLLRIGIKRVPGGQFSTWANERLQAGHTLESMLPMGTFHVPLDASNRRHHVAFAAGSGITPVLGILKATLAGEPLSRFTLFYGNRASSSIMFREELEDLKNRHLQRLSLVHILSREQQDIDLLNGRLDRAKCDQLLERWLRGTTIDMAFICGPQDMMLQISDSLQAHGLDKARIKFELFAAADTGRGRERVREVRAAAQTEQCQATIILDGRARQLAIVRGATTVLDAALGEGIEVPYACKAGVCSTCRAMLLEGEVDMDANLALEDYEVRRGYILTCQSYPVTDRIVVDYDK